MSDPRILPTNRPAGLVTFTIKIDGEEISQTIGIFSIVVNKEVNKIPSANVIVRDGRSDLEDFEISSQDLFIPGKEIEILAGYQSEESTIFKGIIISHGIRIRNNGGSRLVLECKDRSVKLTIGAKNKYFVDKKDSEAIEEIIDSYGLEKDIEATDVQHPDLVQYESTDWDFMLSRIDANGKVCLVNDGKITVNTPSLDGEPVLNLVYGDTIKDFDATIDARDQFQAVKAVAWDPSSQELLEIDAQDPGIGGNGNLTPSDLASVIGLEHFSLHHSGMLAQDELQSWADAQWQKKQLAKIRGRVRFNGFGEIIPGDLMELGGLGDRINGIVYISGIRQELTEGGWNTDAQFGLSPNWFTASYPVQSLPASGLLPAIHGLQIGIVTQLKEDPDGEDRILVKVPVISNEEQGIWARIACVDAGNNRGSFFRPEIGDEVVLGFLNNDPRDPIVLGGLNSSSMPSPVTATDENHEKGFVTRSEMKFIFDDDKKSITMETPAGKSISMDEDAGTIKLEDEHGNKILMNSDGITIESKKKIILKTADDIESEGMNIKNSAKNSFKADGTGGIELTSSAIAKLKGALVQIN